MKNIFVNFRGIYSSRAPSPLSARLGIYSSRSRLHYVLLTLSVDLERIITWFRDARKVNFGIPSQGGAKINVSKTTFHNQIAGLSPDLRALVDNAKGPISAKDAKMPPTNTAVAYLNWILAARQIYEAAEEKQFPDHNWDVVHFDISSENWNRAYVLLRWLNLQDAKKTDSKSSRSTDYKCVDPLFLTDKDYVQITETGQEAPVAPEADPLSRLFEHLEEQFRMDDNYDAVDPTMTEAEYHKMVDAAVQHLEADATASTYSMKRKDVAKRLPISKPNLLAYLEGVRKGLIVKVSEQDIDKFREGHPIDLTSAVTASTVDADQQARKEEAEKEERSRGGAANTVFRDGDDNDLLRDDIFDQLFDDDADAAAAEKGPQSAPDFNEIKGALADVSAVAPSYEASCEVWGKDPKTYDRVINRKRPTLRLYPHQLTCKAPCRIYSSRLR